MTFAPMIHPVVLAALAVAVLVLAVVRVFQLRSVGAALAWTLRVAMVLALCGVLLRPAVPAEGEPVQAANIDVYLLVDTTSSVAAEDWADGGTRLDAIRADIGSVVNEFAGARFALITFDRIAQMRVPLTTDAAAILTTAEILTPEVYGYSRGSSIGLGAPLLLEQLRSSAEADPERTRAVFYFGDGEQTAATSPESFSGSADYIGGGGVFAYGTEAGGQMVANDAHQKVPIGYIIDAATGSPALSRVDMTRLGVIAEQLAVPIQARSAETAIAETEVRGGIPFTLTEGTRAGVSELYWVPALALFALLVIELAGFVIALAGSGFARRHS